MIPLDNTPEVKGFLFAGCSFTWGQGLYYYSNLPTLKEPPRFEYRHEYVTEAHKRYMESVRFPRLVANHFKTWEVVHPFNGGSNNSAVKWWRSSFNEMPQGPDITDKKYDYSEFSHVFFQLTQWHRNNFLVELNGAQYRIPMNVAIGDDNSGRWPAKFHQWLKEKNLTFEQWQNQYIDDNLAEVKQFLQEFEDHGVPTTLILWPEHYNHEAKGDEYISRITADPWLDQRLLRLKYQGKTYNSMERLMRIHPEMVIESDHRSFKETPKDHHPSLLCHKVMANNIIEHLIKLGHRI
jgi:hypothetical protein